MNHFAYLSHIDAAALDDLFNRYKQDPESVETDWQRFFEGFEFSGNPRPDGEMKPIEFKVIDLINDYRTRGHLFTKTNPVRTRRQYSPTLALENYGLSEADLNTVLKAGREIGIGDSTLQQILDHLQQTYCESIGVEYAYIRNVEIFDWLKSKMEQSKNTPQFDPEKKLQILNKLSQAVFFEQFLHKKFVGQKRFSLEGCESLIPAIDALIEKGSALSVEEFVIGMPHRGRLNVLANILGKPAQTIFNEFEGKEPEDESLLGDVKYHLGFSSEKTTSGGKNVKLSLAPNPSHLEAVLPVVEGFVRNKIDFDYQGNASKIVPILLHGDASIAGQGVVYETLQMSELEAYKTGGSIHLVVNNQVGFTTNYLEGRSSVYCTDVAKTIQCPIFHVNADDVEAVVFAVELAMEFRERFHKDVFIDLLGYRRYGHNEGDEPRFTQPVLYHIIEKHPDPRTLYVKKLSERGEFSSEQAKQQEIEILHGLEENLAHSKSDEKARIATILQKNWSGMRYAVPEDFDASPATGVPKKQLVDLVKKITFLPENKPFFKKLVKLTEERRNMLDTNSFDWAMGELLAYASLATENIPVRLSGQDTLRGTFSHRHALLTMEDSEERYIPLQHLSDKQAPVQIYNSLLSEYAALGFEYGYSLASPHPLTLWEAQFGDFSNGAQIIIDQYLSSAEEKWKVMNSLVLLLPHGYEGQGPEHSSGRMERYLQLCADYNLQIANCTTPANFFHLLRRQVKRDFRKPLVVFTPKSLLRHPLCVSPLEDFEKGNFQEVIDDPSVAPEAVKRVVFCSGKIYYELLAERQKRNRFDTALIRIEQLFPFPLKQVKKLLEKYAQAERFVWSQEEPANQGAWSFIARHFKQVDILLVARPESGSPAEGNSKFHAQRQAKIIDKTFGDCTCEHRNQSCKMVCSPDEWSFAGEPKNAAHPIQTKIK